MKISIFVQLVAFHRQLSCAAATPVNEPSTITDVEPYVEKRALTIQVDCNELINQVLKGIDNYPFFASQVVAVGKKVGLPSTTAFAICKTFKTDAIDCKYAAISVGSSISLAIIHGFIDLNPPTKGATAATEAQKKRTSLHYEEIGDYLRSRGTEFEHISVQPLMARHEDSAVSGHFVEVKGVRDLDQDFTTDFHIYSRSDGSGDIKAIPYTTDRLGRRASKAGYKTVWEVTGRKDKPPQTAIAGLAQVMANDWQSRVEGNHNIGDYIGLVDFGNIGRIQLRVISESGGFGDNAETVSKCST